MLQIVRANWNERQPRIEYSNLGSTAHRMHNHHTYTKRKNCNYIRLIRIGKYSREFFFSRKNAWNQIEKMQTLATIMSLDSGF